MKTANSIKKTAIVKSTPVAIALDQSLEQAEVAVVKVRQNRNTSIQVEPWSSKNHCLTYLPDEYSVKKNCLSCMLQQVLRLAPR